MKEYIAPGNVRNAVGMYFNGSNLLVMSNQTIYSCKNESGCFSILTYSDWVIYRVWEGVILRGNSRGNLSLWSWLDDELVYQIPEKARIQCFERDGHFVETEELGIHMDLDDFHMMNKTWIQRENILSQCVYRLIDPMNNFQFQLTPLVTDIPNIKSPFFVDQFNHIVHILIYCDGYQMNSLMTIYNITIADGFSRYVLFRYHSKFHKVEAVAMDYKIQNILSMSVVDNDHLTLVTQKEIIKYNWRDLTRMTTPLQVTRKKLYFMEYVNSEFVHGANHTAWFHGKLKDAEKFSLFMVDQLENQIIQSAFFDYPVLTAVSGPQFPWIASLFAYTLDTAIYTMKYYYQPSIIHPPLHWSLVALSLFILLISSVMIIGSGFLLHQCHRCFQRIHTWRKNNKYNEKAIENDEFSP